MRIMINRKLSRHKAKIFTLCSFNIRSLTYLFFGVLFGQQFISAGIEYAFWGETFEHLGDSVFMVLITGAYFYYANELGEFLLDLHLNAEVIED